MSILSFQALPGARVDREQHQEAVILSDFRPKDIFPSVVLMDQPVGH
jgi:hypothetical protein